MNGYSNNGLPHMLGVPAWTSDRTTVIGPNQAIWNGPQTVTVERGVTAYHDHELVMELIARGYAVAKMPAEELAEGVGG